MPFRVSTVNRTIAVTLGAGVTAAQAISAAVGWQAMASPFERAASAAAAPLAGAAAAGLWLLIARAPHALRRLLRPSPGRIERTIAAARAAGLLPDGYEGGPQRDLLVARTIAFDRKAGLTDEEIGRDLADLLSGEPPPLIRSARPETAPPPPPRSSPAPVSGPESGASTPPAGRARRGTR